MARPYKPRIIKFNPNVTYFKPRAVPLSKLEEVYLSVDELESIRLHDLNDCNQTNCAQKMEISPSTFQRILTFANKKIAQALTEGKAIKISKKI
ncbi:MAG: hypothetical protein COV69_01260 [Parcubacteria group bacterium CG11_big_fil_rev_8_21_14_0_20_39_14]|nr:MAG: hypothetical protein COV69_01260 [Parcubacteria group bacterium CG11_big_fil_rev_8_21_14_0_20_39_14]PIS35078.1 MAG: hypothetical protein COT36_03960 [Parcubacteria group bacterium CG08_land_8_20_14_0_20_38_56]